MKQLMNNNNPQLVSDSASGNRLKCDEIPILMVCDLQGCRPTTPDAPSQLLMKAETK